MMATGGVGDHVATSPLAESTSVNERLSHCQSYTEFKASFESLRKRYR